MSRREIDKKAMFQSIRGASEITGLSQKYIREGCKRNEIPHLLVGTDYRVNMGLFLSKLNAASEVGANVR